MKDHMKPKTKNTPDETVVEALLKVIAVMILDQISVVTTDYIQNNPEYMYTKKGRNEAWCVLEEAIDYIRKNTIYNFKHTLKNDITSVNIVMKILDKMVFTEMKTSVKKIVLTPIKKNTRK